MRPIVLATDGSATAALATSEAIGLAAACNAPLVVVTAWDVPYTGLGYAPLPLMIDVDPDAAERSSKIADQAAKEARVAGVSAQTEVRRGFPVDVICSTAADRDARLIVVGSHGWGRFRRTLFGSVSRGVLKSAPCPVLIVPAARVPDAEEAADHRVPLEV